MLCTPTGPVPAKIMLVGEAPGAEEERLGQPFVGASGQELTRMLHDVGITRTECFLTNVVRERPPNNDISAFIAGRKKDITSAHKPFRDKYVTPNVLEGVVRLREEIARVQPACIVAFGNTALWALSGKSGITSWRGSLLYTDGAVSDTKRIVLPTYHPAAILRQWDWRWIAIHDLRRAKHFSEHPEVTPPPYDFLLRPSFGDVMITLSRLEESIRKQPTEISLDIETRHSLIACIGLAWSPHNAICIPLMASGSPEGYWNFEEELEIVAALRSLLSHPNCRVLWQNGLYDAQYFARYLGFIPRHWQDTMLSHHCVFPGLPKGLDFLSSLYCSYHEYWKEEGKTWEPGIPEEQLWNYNCKDAAITYEVAAATRKAVASFKLEEPHAFQQRLFPAVLDMMLVGVRVNQKARGELALELLEELRKRDQYFIDVLGHPLNPRSPLQMSRLFYEDFQQRPVINRKTGQPTLNDEALQRIAEREPLLRYLIAAIGDHRTLGVFHSTFISSALDTDGRMRCSFNIAGTETFRFSSSQNAFGSGMNLENVPSDKSKALGKALRRAEVMGDLAFKLPNVRKLFIPDQGQTFFECDLERADLHVVVWEANDEKFKIVLRERLDIHLMSAGDIFGLPITIEDLRDPEKVKWLLAKYPTQREFAKVFVHGSNYGGSGRTMAAHVGVPVVEAEAAQQRWFYQHPGINAWHRRIENEIQATRTVWNKFGYRRYYFDRIEEVLPEALAWVPQSTVATVINKGLVNIYENLKRVQCLLQNHDALAGQYPTYLDLELKPKILQHLHIPIPYSDPLTIPIGIKTSTESWGDCR